MGRVGRRGRIGGRLLPMKKRYTPEDGAQTHIAHHHGRQVYAHGGYSGQGVGV